MSIRALRLARLGLIASVTAVTAGCGLVDPIVCTADIKPSILVDVRDAETGERVRGVVRVVAADGAFVAEVDTEEFSIPPGADRDTVAFGPFFLGEERPGTYAVTVEAAGYEPWQQDGVRVRQGECHVRTQELTALLAPVEPGASP